MKEIFAYLSMYEPVPVCCRVWQRSRCECMEQSGAASVDNVASCVVAAAHDPSDPTS